MVVTLRESQEEEANKRVRAGQKTYKDPLSGSSILILLYNIKVRITVGAGRLQIVVNRWDLGALVYLDAE